MSVQYLFLEEITAIVPIRELGPKLPKWEDSKSSQVESTGVGDLVMLELIKEES